MVLTPKGNAMNRASPIAWVLVSDGHDSNAASVFVMEDGSTDPPDYRLPMGSTVKIQMLIQDHAQVMVEGERIVVVWS